MFLKYPGKYVQQGNDVYHSIQSDTPRNTKLNSSEIAHCTKFE